MIVVGAWLLAVGASDFWSAARDLLQAVSEHSTQISGWVVQLRPLVTGFFVWGIIGAFGGCTLVLRSR